VAVRFGILYNIEYYPEVHKSPSNYYGQILEQVDLLEDLGYDAVWFSEHHYSGYSFGNPAVIATAAAARTKRIRLGTGVSLVPLHYPIRLAEEYAMVDVLSGGRFDYGAGRGFISYGYDIFGVDLDESHARYREGLDLIAAAWRADGPLSFDGKFWKLKDYEFFPQPVQRPTPPIYAAGAQSPESYLWAGARGYNLCTAFFNPDKAFVRENIRRYRQALADHGFDPATRAVAGLSQMYCAETKAEALRDGGEYALNYYKFFARMEQKGSRTYSKAKYEDADVEAMDQANIVLLGDPDDLIARIKRVVDFYGIDLFLLEVAQGGAPRDKALRALELFGKHVIPAFRAPAATAVAR
jgi:alkanesulfonate monooxygenase SsuD/methylene tetrahydromethanopterin reductase-like flavin-dependent oxidoreductase (luciferase family)